MQLFQQTESFTTTMSMPVRHDTLKKLNSIKEVNVEFNILTNRQTT